MLSNASDEQTPRALSVHVRIWAAYLLFHTLLFLPAYLLSVSGFPQGVISLEVAVLFALWAIFGKTWKPRKLRLFSLLFVFLYAIALIYKSYAGVLSGIYQRDANFFNDYSFVLGGIVFLFDGLNLSAWTYLAGGVGLIAFISLLVWGTRITFEGIPLSALGKSTRFTLIALGGITMLVGGLFPKKTAALQTPVNSITIEIVANIQRSAASRDSLEMFAAIDPSQTYDYSQYPLSQTPDVIFLFVESYGSVLYQRPHFTPSFIQMSEALEESLAHEGWGAVSTLSEAPTWGGGSWMSYTSVLFGLSVQEQNEYNSLKETYSILEYPNLGRYFRSQGYDYTWVVTIDRKLSQTREAIDRSFYGANRWITFDTLSYDGPLFGWGPSAPDQFTFGFIHEFLAQQTKPTFLFYLTQNSHYPWNPLPPLLDNWRELENLNMIDGVLSDAEKKGISLNESRQNYLQAIDNTLLSINEFIASLENENTIVVLIGDHQPPTVSRRDDGFGTMVHIISRNQNFLESFHEYGFVNGLVLENLESTIRHEGLYSLFARNFVEQYGKSPWVLPPYLPNGHQ